MKIIVIFLAVFAVGSCQDVTEKTTVNVEESTVTTEEPTVDETIIFLNLSNKNLNSLQHYNFSNYPELVVLDLSNNNISYIQESTFEKNRKLKTLNLTGNRYLQIPEYSTLLISSVEQLILSNCNIKSLSDSVFDGFLKLQVLDLSNNPIENEDINTNALSPLHHLTTLVVSQVYRRPIKSLCNERDLTIDIKSPNNNETVKCADIRSGAWTKWSVKTLETPTPSPPQTTIATTINEEIIKEEIIKEEIIKEEITPEPIKEVNVPVAEVDKIKLTYQEVQVETTTVQVNKEANIDQKPEIGKEQANETLNTDQKNNQTKETAPNSFQRAIPTPNKSEKATDDTKEGAATSTESNSSAGTNVLVFLVVAVVIAGLAAFGYKYYKSKKESENHTPIEKELKEITVDRRIASIKPPNTIEEEPLMNGNKSGFEFKELNKNEDTNPQEQHKQGSSYIPITSVEKVPNANDNSNDKST